MSACVCVSTVAVLAWIGLGHVVELYKDNKRVERGVEAMADQWENAAAYSLF